MGEPALPARGQQLPRLQVEGQPEAVGRRRVRVVARRHGQVHQAHDLVAAGFVLGPEGLQKALHPAVVQPRFQAGAGFGHVPGAGLAGRPAVLGQLIQGIGPVGAVHEIEVGIAGVIGHRAPVSGVLHAVHDGAVTAGGLAEAAPAVALGQGAQLAVHEGDELAGEVVGVLADGAGIDVLVAPQGGEAVGEHDDGVAHAALVDQPRGPLGDVFVEVAPGGVGGARASVAHQVVQHREALVGILVVLRRQPYLQLADMGVAQGIVPQDVGVVLQGEQFALGPVDALECHGGFLVCLIVWCRGAPSLCVLRRADAAPPAP